MLLLVLVVLLETAELEESAEQTLQEEPVQLLARVVLGVLRLPVVLQDKVQVLFNQLHIQQEMSPLRLVLHRLEVSVEMVERLLEHLLVLVQWVVLVEPVERVQLPTLRVLLVTIRISSLIHMRVELSWQQHQLEQTVVLLVLVVVMHQEELRAQVRLEQTVALVVLAQLRMLLVLQV